MEANTMPEMRVNCGAAFASPAELIRHMSEAHSGSSSNASLSMNSEAERPGLL